MPTPDNTINKPAKDRDLKSVTYFLRVAGLAVPFLCLLGLYLGYVRWGLHGAIGGALGAIIIGLGLSALIMYLLDAAGGAAGNLLSGRREAVWTPREQLEGVLSQARFNKDNGDYTVAFKYINQVLQKDPDFPEALILKAQILWEGFSRADAALQFLEKVLTLKDCDKMLLNQAGLLHGDLSVLENPAAGIMPPEGVEIGLKTRTSRGVQKLSSESYQDLKERMVETPVAVWAIYTSAVFGLALVGILISMYLQIQRFDQAEAVITQNTKSFNQAAQSHKQDIQTMEKRFKALKNRVHYIEKKVKRLR